MSVRNAKDAIREARLKAGLTQEQLAEGVCSLQALSRIESGVSGVSPATFQALMEHAGASCERFPTFASREDFDCYCSLKYARFHLEAWQLKDSYEELQKLEAKNWANNRLFYQEWLLLHCELQFYSYCYSHEQNRNTLLAALHITRPHIDLSDFGRLLLSQNEIRLLILLAQEFLYLSDGNLCLQITAQLDSYLFNSSFSAVEKKQLQAKLAIVQAKYMISTGDCQHALQTIDYVLKDAQQKRNTAILFCLTFLKGLCYYYTGDVAAADRCIKAAFYSSHAVNSCYATVCRRYLLYNTDYPVSDHMKSLPDVPLTAYPVAVLQDTSCFSDGVYSADVAEAYTLGDIIQDFRLEQGLSQQIICQGLCSKSKLSKIENGTLQPDIALAEALLQRLGLSERIFTFWGNEREARFYELKFKLMDIQHLPKEKKIPYIQEMAELLHTEDTLYRQQYLTECTVLLNSPEETVTALTEALHLTLPDFDIYEISRYRLTWSETTILNMIASAYRHTQKSYLSFVYFSQLLDYRNRINPSLRLQVNSFSLTFCMFCESLYSQRHYKDILSFWDRCDLRLFRHSFTCYSSFLFYYCQALGECKNYEKSILPTVYCCNMECLVDNHKNENILKEYLREDFSIELKY